MALALLSACGGDDEAGERTAGRAPAGQRFTNPVYDVNFPDPFVLRANGRYYAYATNGEGGNVQTLVSGDLVRWTPGKDALPELGAWATPGFTWAPEVLRVGDGRYVLYYTARATEPDRQCIGAATADSPAGPFVDRALKPLVCQADEGGSIDASGFDDGGGRLYLLWKNDGNCCGLPTFLYGQQLSKDGLRPVGRRARLVRNDAAWEGNLVEAPTLWKEGGRYYLFYSANDFASESYAVGYANCRTPLGPCEDAAENPILATRCTAAGPGHQTLIRDDDETWLVYHAWPPDAIGSAYPGRTLWIDRVAWRGGKPVIAGPTCRPQPVP